MNWLIVYLIIINAGSFLIMLADKNKAHRRQWRIPERTLLGLAAIGGSLGTWLAMLLFRHKTLHARFRYGVPAMLAVQTALLIWLL